MKRLINLNNNIFEKIKTNKNTIGVNIVSKELIYVLDGEGVLNFADKKLKFKGGTLS